jgi:serine/threonine-protein phosphatase 2A regulatory subunit B'
MSRAPTSSRRVMVARKDGLGKGNVQSAKVIERSNLLLKNRKMMVTPRADMVASLGIQKSITSCYAHGDYGSIEELPELSSVPPNQFCDVLKQKLKACCIMCDFGPGGDPKNVTTKSRYLTEIMDHLSQPRYFQLCDATVFDSLFEMIKTNILRAMPPIPPLARSPIHGEDIKDTWQEGTWPHLALVYEIFMRFLESAQLVPAQHIKRFDSAFIVQFLELFNSSDARERDALKNVLLRIYLKFNQLRPKMRQSIQEIFVTFLYETKYFNGINELLDFYMSIINGFAVPIKPENIRILMDVLLPLHGSDFFHVFHENLFQCILQFIEKDSNLIPNVLKGLIRYWPGNTVKALLFLGEIGVLIDAMSEDQFKAGAVDINNFVGRLIEGLNFQVSEAAVYLWKSDYFVQLMAQFATITFPVIIPYLYRCGSNHWNPQIKNIAISVLRICMQTAPEIYEEVKKAMQQIEEVLLERRTAEMGAWLEVAKIAAEADAEVQMVSYPATIEEVFST